MTSKFIIGCNHIGSHTDIPPKVIEYLNSGNFVWVEHKEELMIDIDLLGIKDLTNYKVFTDHTLEEQIEQTRHLLESGKDVMLLTHMGYPGTADPGSDLIKHIRLMGFEIEIIAGPSIAPLAVALSGITQSERGYLVRETFSNELIEIDSYLENIKDIYELLVFIDFNHKITDIISSMLKVFKEDREACIILNAGLKNQSVISGKYTDILAEIDSYPKSRVKKILRYGQDPEEIDIPKIFIGALMTIVSKGKP